MKALLFDSLYERHKGAIIYLAILDGILKQGDRLCSSHRLNCGIKDNWEVKEVGILAIDRVSTGILYPGTLTLHDLELHIVAILRICLQKLADLYNHHFDV